jgi:hypothetical protein
MIMRTAAKGILFGLLVLSLSGADYAQGGGAGGGGAAGGQGGTGMSTPNAGGDTGSVSGASGASTMNKSGSAPHKKMKKGEMDSPASDAGTTKKTY